MANKKLLQLLLYTFVFIWWLVLIGQGTAVPSNYLKPVGFVITTVILLFGIFEKWIWQWRWLHPWLVPVPNLIGTWKGVLISDWIDPTTNQPNPPIEAYLVIRQTLNSIHIKLMTQQSNSDLIAGSFIKADSTHHVTGVYMNITKINYREKSPIHYGGILLEIQENSITTLEGHYWTDRKTKGKMLFKENTKELSASFEDASDKFK